MTTSPDTTPDATLQTTPDPSAPSSEAATPQVFRFFNESQGLQGYLKGTWAGFGAHGIPEDEEAGAHARLRLRKGELQISLEKAIVPVPGMLQRLAQRLRGAAAAAERSNVSLRKTGQGLRTETIPAGSSAQCEVDFARIEGNQLSISLQALTENRLHLTVYAADVDGHRRVAFAGAVHRR